MNEDNEKQQWYVRRGSTIQGPYGVEQLRRYLLLGRVRLTDRASRDGESWHAITQCAELIPEEMRDLDSEEGRARFEAARRAVDERQEGEPDDPVPGGERADDLPVRASPRRWAVLALAVVVAVALLLVGIYGNFGAAPVAANRCDDAPAPGTNWNYCDKDGLELPPGTDLRGASAINATFRNARLAGVALTEASLAYTDFSDADLHDADLSGVDFEGADLRGADLRGAILSGANLAHADLRGATIDGARLADADRERAVWVDGRPCTRGDMARCRP